MREQRDALDAAQDRFNEDWERFQDEREEHGRQTADWERQYQAKFLDIRTREKNERVPRADWIPEPPTAPVVERKSSPLPPRRSGGARGSSPFKTRKPRP